MMYVVLFVVVEFQRKNEGTDFSTCDWYLQVLVPCTYVNCVEKHRER